MAKVNIAQSRTDCTYILQLTHTEWSDLKDFLINAACIAADFESGAKCSVRTRKRLVKAFYTLKNSLESVMHRVKRLTKVHRRRFFTEDEWQIFRLLLLTGCGLASIVNPDLPPEKPEVARRFFQEWKRLEKPASEMIKKARG